ncbi:MAG TPA: DNA-formamidopyrimidine glycosylase family protein, partial [Acidimicrobiales bacterium]|nr:DNA-formamidopyrimidine glycosylase family protein [Acidimicrobiales bacterium]
MPELPEVETIRRDLEKEVLGRRIKSVEVKGKRSVRRHKTGAEFRTLLEGRKVTGIRRGGKYLLVDLDDGDVLVVHLGMSGQLLRVKSAREPLERHAHVVVTFTQGGQLRFVDPRTFGELFVTKADELSSAVPELAHLGFDPLEDVMSWARFGMMLADRHA